LERILANPLPVDVTSTWWDYVVDVADVLAGLGTMGALVVAAMVYRRQEHDKRIIQASRIIVSATIDEAQSTAMITVRNRSDLPVYGVSFYQNDWTLVILCGPEKQASGELSELGPGDEHTERLSCDDYNPKVLFRDAAGRHWQRRPNGQLKESKSFWMKRRDHFRRMIMKKLGSKGS
jgi:hypothetical protein